MNTESCATNAAVSDDDYTPNNRDTADATAGAVAADARAAVFAARAATFPAVAPFGVAAAAAAAAARGAAADDDSIRSDFDLLVRLAREERWDDSTPVPPEVFGPLWPDGPPPGWPAQGEKWSIGKGQGQVILGAKRLSAPPDTGTISPQIEVYFPADELSPDDVELFLEYLNAVYRKKTGGRLVVVDPKSMEPEAAEVLA